jgi:exopolyphosphatase/guanosine-5'-triphosphate,3'-diphosphate pyrophosphatase
MSQPAAAIDLGTNTARLLIGSVDVAGAVEPLLVKRHITRLGGGFTRERGISPEACARTVAALKDFADEIGRHGVTRVKAVATSAVRDAANGGEFCARILRETGIRLEVIDGQWEGLLTLRGVLAGLDATAGNLLVFDVGGGSTEYTVSTGMSPLFSMSLPLGVVRLTEGKGSPDAMREKIARELGKLREEFEERNLHRQLDNATLVGTAGTATTLAAISLRMTDYDYRRVNNYTLRLQEIREIFALLLPMTPAERLAVPGLEEGREDLLIAGMLITIATMETFGFTQLKVSDFGLLEGVLLEELLPRREG